MIQVRKIFSPLLVLILLWGCQLTSGQQRPADLPDGSELFQSKCGSCHPLERALNKNSSADLWRSTITRMKEEHGAPLTPAEVDQLVDFHVRRQQQEAAIFREKCQKCHTPERYLDKQRTPDAAREIIKRMQQKAGNRIDDEDVDIIVRYHIQAQQSAMEQSLSGLSKFISDEYSLTQTGREVFNSECSLCHSISRTLDFRADSNLWDRTIEQLNKFSNNSITTEEINDLTDWHVAQQQKEVAAFNNTCTRCHDDRRINRLSMTDEQWIETIRRMLQKVPELYSDEKVSLIAAYFHRRELALSKTFSGPCIDCHTDQREDPAQNRSFLTSTVADKELTKIHAVRQQQEMQLFTTKCFRCHPERSSTTGKFNTENKTTRARREWVEFIANLQNLALNEATIEKVGYQIEFHLFNN